MKALKHIVSWFEKHINFKKEEEFVIFVVWAVLSATIFLSIIH